MRLRSAFRLLALALPAGCSWYSAGVEVRATFPAAPEHWRLAFPQLAYELDCPQADCPPAGNWAEGFVAVRLPKRVNWPVLAYPAARGVLLPPAGALYPRDLAEDGVRLPLSWEHGPAAQVLRALVREGLDVSLINGERLLAEMLARSNGDPGSLDLVHLADRLASGGFRATDIRLLPTRDLALDLPAGTWFLGSPFRAALPLNAGQALELSAVPLGRHRLLAVELPGGFDLFVSEREALLVPLVPD